MKEKEIEVEELLTASSASEPPTSVNNATQGTNNGGLIAQEQEQEQKSRGRMEGEFAEEQGDDF